MSRPRAKKCKKVGGFIMRSKKMWKNAATCILALCMLAGCLTGCGEKGNSDLSSSDLSSSNLSSSDPSSKEPDEPKEPANLSYWCALDSNSQQTLVSFNDMEMLKEAQELVNVNVTYTHPASGTEQDQFNLKMTNRELEDIMENAWGSYPGGPSQAITDGIIIDLAPYIEQGYAPNFKKLLDENPGYAKQITTDKGEIYAFPAIGDAQAVSAGYIVRNDMLKAVNLEAPETIADWEEMLIAFRDKLRVKSPMTGTSGQLIGENGWLAGAFDTYPGYYLRDGKVQYGYMDHNFKTYLETMRRWYEEGLIDQDFFGNDTKTVNSKILNDDSGAFFGYIGTGIGTLMNSAKESNPDLELVAVPYPVGKAGDVAKFMKRSWEVKAGGQAAITTACKDIEAAMAYLDFWYSEEGSRLKNFGVEGVSYEMRDGLPYYTDEILKNPDGLSISAALGKYTRASQASVGLIDARYYEQYYQLPQQVDAVKLWNKNTDPALEVTLPAIAPTAEEAEEMATINAAVSTYVKEETTKFIMGLRDLNEFDSYVESLKGLNIDRALEIKQAAYERYLAR